MFENRFLMVIFILGCIDILMFYLHMKNSIESNFLSCRNFYNELTKNDMLILLGYITAVWLYRSNFSVPKWILMSIAIVCSIFLLDNVLFNPKRTRKNIAILQAIELLSSSGVSHEDFLELSYDEQIRLLKNTPSNPKEKDSFPLVKDASDLEIFKCILNNPMEGEK